MFLHILAKGIFLNEERGIHKHNVKWWWIHSKYFVFEVTNVSWIVASSECHFLPYFCQTVRMMLIENIYKFHGELGNSCTVLCFVCGVE